MLSKMYHTQCLQLARDDSR
nr:unnamed protein product [Callosobruchus analis]